MFLDYLKRSNIVREAFTKKENKTWDISQTGGGSGQSGRMSQPPLMSNFLKVTPLIWASEGQNNVSKQIRHPNFLGGGGWGCLEVSRGLPNVLLFFLREGFPYM